MPAHIHDLITAFPSDICESDASYFMAYLAGDVYCIRHQASTWRLDDYGTALPFFSDSAFVIVLELRESFDDGRFKRNGIWLSVGSCFR